MLDENILKKLESIPEPKNIFDFVIYAESLFIEDDNLFCSYFNEEMKKLGYTSTLEKKGKEDRIGDHYSFKGVEIRKYEKGDSLANLITELEIHHHQEADGSYHEWRNIKFIKLTKNSVKDVSTVILSYLTQLKDEYEERIKHWAEKLQKINSTISKLERVR